MMRLQLLEKKHVPELEEGREGHEERVEGSHVVVGLVKALEDVPDEGIIGDRDADIRQRVGDGFLLKAVGRDGLTLLLQVA
jgi:hypothetical protein